MLNYLKKQFYLKILKRNYFKKGVCKKCGRCCHNIYVRHDYKTIKTKEEFEKIKSQDGSTFYKNVEVVGVDDFGLLFSCKMYDPIKKLCKHHRFRPLICRKYPDEAIFKMGAQLKEDCGYYFEPIESFKEVYLKISKKPFKNFDQSD